MPTQLPRHPALMARSMLLEGWTASNTSSLDPNVAPHLSGGLSLNRGWYSSVNFDPHVALVQFAADVRGGGDSGYSGIDPSGDGPTQERLGSGIIGIFAEGDAEYGADNLTAPEMAFALRQEIEDIVMVAEADTDPLAIPDPWTHVATSPQPVPVDDDKEPAVYREQLQFSFSWHRLP